MIGGLATAMGCGCCFSGRLRPFKRRFAHPMPWSIVRPTRVPRVGFASSDDGGGGLGERSLGGDLDLRFEGERLRERARAGGAPDLRSGERLRARGGTGAGSGLRSGERLRERARGGDLDLRLPSSGERLRDRDLDLRLGGDASVFFATSRGGDLDLLLLRLRDEDGLLERERERERERDRDPEDKEEEEEEDEEDDDEEDDDELRDRERPREVAPCDLRFFVFCCWRDLPPPPLPTDFGFEEPLFFFFLPLRRFFFFGVAPLAAVAAVAEKSPSARPASSRWATISPSAVSPVRRLARTSSASSSTTGALVPAHRRIPTGNNDMC